MTIREYLKSIGATDAQLTAKVVDLMEQRMLFDTDMSNLAADTVANIMSDMITALNSAAATLDTNSRKEAYTSAVLADKLDLANARAAELKALSEDMGRKILNVSFSDIRMQDAVNAYGAILQSTKNIFGEENMTEDVMKSAVDAGSYVAWCAIKNIKGGCDESTSISSEWLPPKKKVKTL